MTNIVKRELRLPEQVDQQMEQLKIVTGHSKNVLQVMAARDLIQAYRAVNPVFHALCKALEDGE